MAAFSSGMASNRWYRLANSVIMNSYPLAKDHTCALAPVGRAHAAPGVAHLLIMRDRIVDFDPEPEDLRRQRAGRCQHRVGLHHPIALRGDERHPRVDEVLLRVEHVERGALTHAGLLAHAVERNLGRGDLR